MDDDDDGDGILDGDEDDDGDGIANDVDLDDNGDGIPDYDYFKGELWTMFSMNIKKHSLNFYEVVILS